MPTRKRFELLDCPKFAYPSLANIDVQHTAQNIQERLNTKGFLNYGQVRARVPDLVGGRIDQAYIEQFLNGYDDDWKNENLQEVTSLLGSVLAGKGRWFKNGTAPFEVLPGAFFKPSIWGTWYVDKKAYSVGINARKHQRVFPEHARFLARGIYEFHSIDDPHNARPLILDLSAGDDGKRELKRFDFQSDNQMMSVDQFEHILRRFFDALALAGVTTVPASGFVADLFRKPRFT